MLDKNTKSASSHESSEGTKAEVPNEAVPYLIKLLHGNNNSMLFLAMEFAEFWKKILEEKELGEARVEGDNTGTPGGNGGGQVTITKSKMCHKIQEIADYKKITDDGVKCWWVRHEILSKFNVTPALTNEWSYLLEQPNNKNTTTAIDDLNTIWPGEKKPVAVKPAASKKESSSDDSSDEEDAKPAVKVVKPAAKSAKKESSSEDSDSSDEEEVKPAAAKKTAVSSKPAAVLKKDSPPDDSDFSDEEEVVKKPLVIAKPAAAKKESSSDDSDSSEEEVKPVTKKKAVVPAKKESSSDSYVSPEDGEVKPPATKKPAAGLKPAFADKKYSSSDDSESFDEDEVKPAAKVKALARTVGANKDSSSDDSSDSDEEFKKTAVNRKASVAAQKDSSSDSDSPDEDDKPTAKDAPKVSPKAGVKRKGETSSDDSDSDSEKNTTVPASKKGKFMTSTPTPSIKVVAAPTPSPDESSAESTDPVNAPLEASDSGIEEVLFAGIKRDAGKAGQTVIEAEQAAAAAEVAAAFVAKSPLGGDMTKVLFKEEHIARLTQEISQATSKNALKSVDQASLIPMKRANSNIQQINSMAVPLSRSNKHEKLVLDEHFSTVGDSFEDEMIGVSDQEVNDELNILTMIETEDTVAKSKDRDDFEFSDSDSENLVGQKEFYSGG